MIQIALKPIIDKDSYSDSFGPEIMKAFDELIYLPLLDAFTHPNVREQSRATLKKALETGRIQYNGIFFSGELSASISKTLRELGATWDKTRKQFKLEPSKLPQDIMDAVHAGASRVAAQMKKLEDHLSDSDVIAGKILGMIDIGEQFQKVKDSLNDQYLKSVDSVSGDLSVQPELSAYIEEQFYTKYTTNLDYYISQWAEEAIFRLREKVTENVFKGFRSDRLIEQIKAERRVTDNKAKFIARQETSLLVSKYRQARYEDAGVEVYRWSTSQDRRVRDRHKELNGKIFKWDDPPIVDPDTGRRGNPGEDFNCRCVAIALVRLKGESHASKN